MGRIVLLMMLILTGYQVRALDLTTPFASIDGDSSTPSEWHGQRVAVVNTASRCSFAKQLGGLQHLYEIDRDGGLLVTAIPSSDFRPELASADQIKNFCGPKYGIDLPIAAFTRLPDPQAYSVLKSLMPEIGFEPKWNISKDLIGPEREQMATNRCNIILQTAQTQCEYEGLPQL